MAETASRPFLPPAGTGATPRAVDPAPQPSANGAAGEDENGQSETPRRFVVVDEVRAPQARKR